MTLRPLRQLGRRFLPQQAQADIRDFDLIVALMKRELKRDSDCLDIGAGEGLFLTEMTRICSRGEHVAWEPVPEFAVKLRDNFPEAHVHEAALTDRNGYGEFQVSLDNPAWSGLRARPTPNGDRYKPLIVRYERLDDTLPPQVSPRLIKLDVEGAEEFVLRGGTETVRRHRPTIVFAHGVDAAQLYDSSAESIHRLLAEELGYGIRGLDGAGPFDAAELARIVGTGGRHNFVARPL
jgi:FkbM family methyltransferase